MICEVSFRFSKHLDEESTYIQSNPFLATGVGGCDVLCEAQCRCGVVEFEPHEIGAGEETCVEVVGLCGDQA